MKLSSISAQTRDLVSFCDFNLTAKIKSGIIEDRELFKLMYRLRKAQKLYFTRNLPEALQESKKLEKIIDEELELRFNSLFSGGTE